MKDLNTTQTKKELSDLIFNLATDLEFAQRGRFSNATESDKRFGVACQCSFELNIIRLYEDYGIAYYDEEIMIKDYVAQKDMIKREYDLAYAKYDEIKDTDQITAIA